MDRWQSAESVPADEGGHCPRIALKILLEHCGRSTGRWEALAAAMTFEYDEAKLDSLDDAPATLRTF
ncbi:hypothetical protein ACWGCI_39005 [Streptomyces sp. NPDC054949]